MAEVPDRIEKKVVLRAPRSRVWRAISDAEAFGAWFGVELDGPFVAGQRITGKIKPTVVDEEIARAQAPYEGKPFDFVVDRIEPERLFSFRWHPFAVDPNVDYSSEPMTLVTLTLDEVDGGTLLTIVESGFAALPPERRAKAFEMNEGGWRMQATLVEKYLARDAA